MVIVWNLSAIKILGVNLGYNGKMGGNSTFLLRVVSGSFGIQKFGLRPTSFPVFYFELWEKQVSFFPNNMRLPWLIGSSTKEEHSNPVVIMLTLQALIFFEGNDDRNGRTIWNCATSPWDPLKRARLKLISDRIIQLNCGGVCTYASCERTLNIAQLRPPRSIKKLFLSGGLWLIIP